MEIVHESVLLDETLRWLAVKSGGRYFDGTVGLGGHAAAILEQSAPDGTLIGMDRDTEALDKAATRLAPFGPRAMLHHGDFRQAASILGDIALDGALVDLGTSSLQLRDPDRGFSFRGEAPLDMRMDRTGGETAAQALRRLSEKELADVLHFYGEEPFARRIARTIVETRRSAPLRTTGDLANLVRRVAPRSGRPGHDAATRTFQALRIYVNDELVGLAAAFTQLAQRLAVGGRLVVIAFHSLEDRASKQALRDLPRASFQVLTRKPLRPSDIEAQRNPSARSARLRAVERIAA